MDIKVPRGKYVLAVSGGVDSMVLLDLLSNFQDVDLVVAHFNHGIRPDAGQDEDLVKAAAGRYGRPLETGRGRLGPAASEDSARRARYAFLETVKRKHGAKKIVTAHHQDDLIETTLINLLRGTGRRGLTAMLDNSSILRPMLDVSKNEIRRYAHEHQLEWREDYTNLDTRALRNYLRLNILPKLRPAQKRTLIMTIRKTARINADIDRELAALAPKVEPDDSVDRLLFSLLPSDVADELLVYWLRQKQLGEIDKRLVSRLGLALRTAKAGSVQPVKGSAKLVIGTRKAAFKSTP